MFKLFSFNPNWRCSPSLPKPKRSATTIRVHLFLFYFLFSSIYSNFHTLHSSLYVRQTPEAAINLFSKSIPLELISDRKKTLGWHGFFFPRDLISWSSSLNKTLQIQNFQTQVFSSDFLSSHVSSSFLEDFLRYQNSTRQKSRNCARTESFVVW